MNRHNNIYLHWLSRAVSEILWGKCLAYQMLSNVFLTIRDPEWIWHLWCQKLREAEKNQGLFGSCSMNSQKATSKEVFFPSWRIRWDVKKLELSKMSLWFLPKEGRSTEALSQPLLENNWKSKERQRTCSASPQLTWLVTAVGPCWASVYPSLKQESCPSHMSSGCRKGFIKFYDLITNSWISDETPGKPKLGSSLVHWTRWSTAPSRPLCPRGQPTASAKLLLCVRHP